MGDFSLSFGPFRLNPGRRTLYRDDKPLHLGSRALDLLITLVEGGKDLIRKEDLIKRVWPDTYIEEANLRVHVAALRKLLGDQGAQYISTVAGRGYCFVAPVVRIEETPTEPARAVEDNPDAGSDLPNSLTRIIGRAECIDSISNQLLQHRFVTIVGPGGIGKTTVALGVAAKFERTHVDRVCFIELAQLTDVRLIPGVVGSALGLPALGDQALPRLVSQLRKESMLIVLDNCEHLLDAAAPLAETLLKAAPGVRLLTTSRQPLRAEGEHLVHLPGLGFPGVEDTLATAQALAFPAIELFAERAAASLDSFSLDEGNLPSVSAICRCLDGIPLAIELAAARVDLVGIDGLAASLKDSFALLMRGRRTALPRHQTLRATLDWSFNLLPAEEQLVLARLAVLSGQFTMETAIALASRGETPRGNIVDSIIGLVEKSLIATDLSGKFARYRLSGPTRVYALEKLQQSGEFDLLQLTHVELFANVARKAKADWETVPAADWIQNYGHTIDDMRSAIDWGLSLPTQQRFAFDITIDTAPLWFRLSLMDEYRERLQRALECSDIDPSRRARLRIALGHASWYALNDVAQMEDSFGKALEIAETTEDRPAQLQSLWGMWAVRRSRGEYGQALSLAQRYDVVAAEFGEPKSISLANRILSITHHYLGDQEVARRLVETVQSRPARTVRSVNNDFQLDLHVAMATLMARIQWLQGFPDQASATAREAVETALETRHVLSLGYAICMAGCPVALWTGDLPEAERNIGILKKYAAKNRLYSSWGEAFEHVIRLRQCAEQDVLVANYIEARLDVCSISALAGLSAEKLLSGQFCDPLPKDARWSYPETLRVEAEMLLIRRSAAVEQKAEALLLEALKLSRSRSLPSFGLRTAIALANLSRHTGRAAEARSMLEASYGEFTEGFATSDLIRASRLLAELH